MPSAPGSILQRMHLRARLRRTGLAGGHFVEIGPGEGDLSRLLLEEGFTGCGFDLNPEACRRNQRLNADYIRQGKYTITEGDFLHCDPGQAADVILCSMVIEHLPVEQVAEIFRRAGQLLHPGGMFCILVPGSPGHWGIEDEIAGHLRRYRLGDFPPLARTAGLVVRELRGLTYPLSNLLLPLSNRLVRRAEGHKLRLSPGERTLASGARNVPYKTTFPKWAGACLNEITLYPFHVWQRLGANNPNCLVIYCELGRPAPAPVPGPSIP